MTAEEINRLLESARHVERQLTPAADVRDMPGRVTNALWEAFSLQGVALAWVREDQIHVAATAGQVDCVLCPGAGLPVTEVVADNQWPLVSSAPVPIPSLGEGTAASSAGFAFPLLAEGSPIGLLLLWPARNTPLSKGAQAVLQSVAQQIARAAHDGRIDLSAYQTDELVKLAGVLGELAHSLELRDTLRATLRGVIRMCSAEATEVTLFDENTGNPTLSLSFAGGEWNGPRPSPWLCTLDQNVINNLRDALRLPDLRSLPAVVNAGFTHPDQFQSLVVVPLRVRDSLIGLMTAAGRQANAFDLYDQHLLQVLGGQAAFAIRNAQLYEDSRRHLRETRALFAIGQSIMSTLDLDEVLNLVASLAIKTISTAVKCVIHLPNEERTDLVPVAVASHDDRPLNRRPIPIGKGIAGHAMKEQRTIYVPDCQKDPRYLDLGTNLQSLLSAPLLSSETEVIGVITVDSDQVDSFTPEDKRLLTSFAVQAAIAIENAQLFGNLQEAYRELERKQAEILKSRNTLQALFDGITDGISIIDRNYTLVAVNRANTAFVGQHADKIIGNPCYRVFWHRDSPCPACPARDTFATSLPVTATHRMTRRGRPSKTFEVQTYPLLDDSGQVTQVIYLTRDITRKRELEASLAKSATLAAVGQLAAGLAHEINNPLTVILGNGQMLLEDIPTDHPDRPLIEMIVGAGERARRVIAKLLEFSAPVDREPATIDLNGTIAAAIGLLAHALRKNDVHIVTQLQSGLPHLRGFAGYLQTVWMNLILNAIDAVQGEAYEREIVIVSTQKDAETVQVQVIDRGCGIPPESRSRLFEPFFSTKDTGKGSGLGLYTCYHIVRQHHGTIELQSEVGQGTIVTVTLPLAHSTSLATVQHAQPEGSAPGLGMSGTGQDADDDEER
jgi:PAS domain S-box-containing protein